MHFLGHELNLLWLTLLGMTVAVTLGGIFVNYLETFVPSELNELFRFGKTRRGGEKNRLLKVLEVPKDWFSHFYVFSVAHASLWWCLCARVFLLGLPAPDWVVEALDFAASSDRRPAARSEGVILAVTLFLLQSLRRLYECRNVHVSCPSSRMNVLHYLMGLLHYLIVPLAFLSESPGFTRSFSVHEGDLAGGVQWLHLKMDWRGLSPLDAAMVGVFVWASLVQHRSFRTLADLRKSPQVKYALPRGGWFELVSCPHYSAEILIYASLAGLLGLSHRSGLLVLSWVAANQTVAALLSHFWYQDTFPNYPKRRKALIPYLL